MDFGRGVSLKEGKALKLQESWLPPTPAKPNPTNLGRLPPDFSHPNPSIPNPHFVNHNNMGQRNWESASFADHRIPSAAGAVSEVATGSSSSVYQQATNGGNQMGMWNNLPFTDLLALANSGSGVSAAAALNVGQGAGNNGAARRNFPFYLPENDNNNNNQFQSNSANMLVRPNYSVSSNQRISSNNNNAAQMPHYEIRAPYSSGHNTTSATAVYDLNATPNKAVNQVPNRSMTFQSVRATELLQVTPNKSDRIHQNHLPHGHEASRGNGSLEFASLAPVSSGNVSRRLDSIADMSSRMQQSHNLDAVSSGITNFEMGTRMQGNHMSEAVPNRNSLFEMGSRMQENCVSGGTTGSRMQDNQLLEAMTNGNASLQFGNTMQQNRVNGNMSFGFPPPTPDKGRQIQENRHSELLNSFVDRRISGDGKNMSQVDANPNKDNYIDLDSSQDSCLEMMVNSPPPTMGKSSSTLAELQENHQPQQGAENGIDLNKTPQQKPKRKKHRPRVVREGKPNKPTPKSAEKQNNTNEPQRAKRKYVRKNQKGTSDIPSTNTVPDIPSTDTVAETNHPNESNAARSCKRSLNFDQNEQAYESHQESHVEMLNKLNSTMPHTAFNSTIQTQATDLCARDKDTCGTTTLQFSQGSEVRVQESFNLNSAGHIPLPDSILEPTRRGLLRGNLKILARESHQPSTADVVTEDLTNGFVSSGMQRNIYSVASCNNSLNCGQPTQMADNRQQTSVKRTHAQTIYGCSGSVNQYDNRFNSLQVYHNMLRENENIAGSMLSPEIYKKRRMTVASKSQVANIPESQRVAIMQHPANDHLKLSMAQWNAQFLNAGKGFPINGANNQGNALMHEYSSPAQPRQNISQVQIVPSKSIPSRIESPRAKFDGRKAPEVTPAIPRTNNKGRKRSKGGAQTPDLPTVPTAVTQGQNLQSTPAVTQGQNLQSTPPGKDPMSRARRTAEMIQATQHMIESQSADNPANKYTMAASSGSMVSFSSHNDKSLQQNQTSAYGYNNNRNKGKREVIEQLRLIEEICQRLERIKLDGENNALVPFKGADQIVPYEDTTKKRRHQPRVELDEETNRVWKALMGKEANDGTEGTDAEKEKWWLEERRIWRGRIESLIARMHQIQGDRGFTKWNGSVLDSVIGVFLTQNVSDHLSSSAFMTLAARFPVKPTRDDKMPHEVKEMYVEEPEMELIDSENLPSVPIRSQDSHGSNTFHEADHVDNKDTGNCSFGSNEGCFSSGISDKDFGVCQEAPNTCAETQTTRVRCTSFAEVSDGRVLEVESLGNSPQNSVNSSVLQVTVGNAVASKESATLSEPDRREMDDVVSSKNTAQSFIHKEETTRSFLYSQPKENPTAMFNPMAFDNCTSFTELLHTTMYPEYYNPGDEYAPIDLNSQFFCNQSESGENERRLNLDTENVEGNAFCFFPPSSNCRAQVSPNAGLQEVQCPDVVAVENSSLNKESVDLNIGLGQMCCDKQPKSCCDKQPKPCCDKQPKSWDTQFKINEACQREGNKSAEPEILNRMQHVGSNSPNFSGVKLCVAERPLFDKIQLTENAEAESIMTGQFLSSKSTQEKPTSTSKPKGKPAKEKTKEFDWDSLRKDAYEKCGKRERNWDTLDSIDWEAVRSANVNEIADAIKERGMNNMLAIRIKDFLNRLVRDHGSLDLEWLRDVPPDKAKDYLLSVNGLGLKSVECVRLLTLHHLAFPVDTNVGRIAVRLGWVPLQPLPESLQLHLLEMYPIQESIQKYLWPRLCTLDQPLLYELHYQLITMGKVFCTKGKPNCNACPMRAECKHFASAYASAKFFLPAPEEKGMVSSTVPPVSNQNTVVNIKPLSMLPAKEGSAEENHSVAVGSSQMLLQQKTDVVSEERTIINTSEPIVEVPASPEIHDIPESDIEDAFWEDPDEIPVVKLNFEKFALNLQNYMQENNMELTESDISKALVTLDPAAASIPTPKLKNVGRLRTEHQVYELPDSHPLLKEVEQRVPGEVCSYLLAIWTPGETAESIQAPEGCCNSQISGNLCCEQTCFSCNSVREANSQTVRGTLLIPCKTAMRGSFPLNGTYFQVNEVFADHESSLNPIAVPRAWLWNLPRRTVYFGTSVTSIFRGQSTEDIQSCFWRGFVCVRGFDRKSRAPRPLMARLHFKASTAKTSTARNKAKKDE